jgi:hypothetical protein
LVVTSAVLLVTSLGFGTRAEAFTACFDQVQSQFSLRVLSIIEVDAAIQKRVSWLLTAQERSFDGSNRVEIEDLLRAEFGPLSAELGRVAEASMSRPEAMHFRSALRQMIQAREGFTGYVGRLAKALQPTGLIGRLFSKEQKRAELRDELEKGIISCRSMMATCLVDLNAHSQGYRALHEYYRRLGRVIEQQVRVWQGVSQDARLGSEARLRAEQHISSLLQMKVVVAGLISSTEADLLAAANHAQFGQAELPVVLTGLVASGANERVMAPVRTRYELEAEAAERAQVEAAKQAEKEGEVAAARERARIAADRTRDERIESILDATKSTPGKRLDLYHELVLSVFNDSQASPITTKQALRLLETTEIGLNWVWNTNGMRRLHELLANRLGSKWASHTERTYVDSEFLVLLIHRLAPEPDAAMRAKVIARADEIWQGSQNQQVNFKAEFKADFETLWRLLKREWEQRSTEP